MLNRRYFLAALAGSALAAPADNPPTRVAKVTKLFKSPEGNPNGLETTSEGLWIAEQISDTAFLVDWKGKVLRKVQTEASNTSGIAYGGGFLWMSANGHAMNRPACANDAVGEQGIIVKADPKTGKTVARYSIPSGGGVHGLEYADNSLWAAFIKDEKLVQLDPKDFSHQHEIPFHLPRPHGIAYDHGALWAVHTGRRTIHKLSAKDGAILEVITVAPEDPEPHGMCMHDGHLIISDAGIAPDGKLTGSPHVGWVCRID